MNYFITHCDEKFLKHAERLFSSLRLNSNSKIIFYTVDFDYKNNFSNVIPIRFNSEDYLRELKNDYKSLTRKAFFVFLKPLITLKVLADFNKEDNFCYLDADCIAKENCDEVFSKFSDLTNYPLLNLGCQEFMLYNGRGNPFANGGMDVSLSLEGPLLKKLNVDVNLRTTNYLQTGVYLFNTSCIDFINEWKDLCYSDTVLSDWEYLAPFHEETVINCLLWQIPNLKNLDRAIINIPESIELIDLMFEKLINPENNLQRISEFCTIPSKDSIKNLLFFHGKCEDSIYNIIEKNMRQFYLLIHCSSLGDTLAATPTLRKLSFVYNSKINVVTHVPELFKNNIYVNKVFSFDQYSKLNNINKAAEVFETFVDIGKKNNKGVEKKHSTIDIRQFHALDLGFCLNETEMEYDFIPEEYQEIENLPKDFVAIHVGSTWPSRTYSKENWQELIKKLTSQNIPVVLLGKNDYELGFYEIFKNTINLNVNLGLDLTNKLTLSQCWHVINKSRFFVTMDSGLLHLAGTTDAFIIQLGSSINNKLRAPFRKNSQDYKYKYISGPCTSFCASDIKHGVKEWGTIQGVPPLINCLEGKPTFECHPNSQDVFNYILGKTNNKKHKIIFIASHLSTGGGPAYLEWLINKKIKEGSEVYVIEYCYYGDYVVQRNSIINLVGKDNFISYGRLNDSDQQYQDNSSSLINFIKGINPDEIFLNEITEIFGLKQLTDEIKSFLYSKDRKFKIIETCHTSEFDFKEKVFIPDEFHFCSDYHVDLSAHLNVPTKVVDMSLPKQERPNRVSALVKLGLDPNFYHVLNVALFHGNKNQKFLYELANELKNYNIQFHFIGNTCFYNDCGLTEELKSLSNCIVHDEKDNVMDYMLAMDLFVLPSHKELNPISIKEALSCNMTCFISDIETLRAKYDKNDNVNFIIGDNLKEYILNHKDITNLNVITDVYSVNKSKLDLNQFISSFAPLPKIEIIGDNDFNYEVHFVLEKNNHIIYKTTINNNMWAGCGEADGRVVISVKNLQTGEIRKFDQPCLSSDELNVINESGSLGDCIAWVPMVQRFAELKRCRVNFYTPYKDIFDTKKYDLINFFDYSRKADIKGSSKSLIYSLETSHDYSLQQIACNILNIPYEEERTVLKPKTRDSVFPKKYVCIATQSTAQAKYWNNKTGWRKVVNYLKSLGYDVVCIDKYRVFGIDGSYNKIPDNCIDKTGDISLQDRIDDLYNCEFFIGLGSGLSWLAWACGKPVIMISGFSKPHAEFHTPYRVINKDVCNGCWNDPNYKFDMNNWLWCPKNKNFECTRKISFELVQKNINILIKDNNL